MFKSGRFDLVCGSALAAMLFSVAYPVFATTRVLLAPYTAPSNPSILFIDQFAVAPSDQFYMQARFQEYGTAAPFIQPFANIGNYNALSKTGLSSSAPTYQRSPTSSTSSQSTYQINGAEVGIYMNSSDGPHPCNPISGYGDCTGKSKHTVWERNFSDRTSVVTTPGSNLLFSSNDPSSYIVIEGDIDAHYIRQWNPSNLPSQTTVGVVAAQLVFVIFFEAPDPNLPGNWKRIQYVIYAFDSYPDPTYSYDGTTEVIGVEQIGPQSFGPFILTSFSHNAPNTYTTVDPTSSPFTSSTGLGYRHYRIRITQQNLINAISLFNSPQYNVGVNADPRQYRLTLAGFNQEFAYQLDTVPPPNGPSYQANGDQVEMGSRFKNLSISEVYGGAPPPPTCSWSPRPMVGWTLPSAKLACRVLGKSVPTISQFNTDSMAAHAAGTTLQQICNVPSQLHWLDASCPVQSGSSCSFYRPALDTVGSYPNNAAGVGNSGSGAYPICVSMAPPPPALGVVYFYAPTGKLAMTRSAAASLCGALGGTLPTAAQVTADIATATAASSTLQVAFGIPSQLHWLADSCSTTPGALCNYFRPAANQVAQYPNGPNGSGNSDNGAYVMCVAP